MLKYEVLSDEMSLRIAREKKDGSFIRVGFDDANAIRRKPLARGDATIWRPTFVHDIDKIMHCPLYNRYTDKTQVFALMKNDDITRRSLHVQLVSRIARTIGSALNLNIDLIEAIALGHDMGHPPFAHTGEAYLDELFYAHTGRHFMHNIHSVRVLDGMYPLNLSLQTLTGIAFHDGEFEMEEYRPSEIGSFEEFDRIIDRCYTDRAFARSMRPSTLEGCVVRISDIIAYLGKDRQDAARVNMVEESAFVNEGIGSINSEIVNNLVVNIIENSYGKPYIKLDRQHFDALRASKRDNYSMIYESPNMRAQLHSTAKPMMAELYEALLEYAKSGCKESPIYKFHIDYTNKTALEREIPYENSDPDQLVVDYIAAMTDDYFIELHHYLFPDSKYRLEYKGYFD